MWRKQSSLEPERSGTMAVIGGDHPEEETPRSGIAADLLKGALAGAAATWAMDQVTTLLYEHEDREARQQEDRARGGDTAYATAAGKAAGAAGVELPEEARAAAGRALHWVLGIAAGAAYAVARRRWPDTIRGSGLPFGVGFFLMADELMNPLLGLTPGPLAFPWQTHARGLAGHVVFGLVTEGTLRALDIAAPPPAEWDHSHST